MSASIDNLAQSARDALDTAYANDPNIDFESVKASILASAIPDDSDKEGWLELASITPDELVITNTEVYGEIYSNGVAIVQAALDDEQSILQGS